MKLTKKQGDAIMFWINECCSRGVDDDEIVLTRDSLSDFATACIELRSAEYSDLGRELAYAEEEELAEWGINPDDYRGVKTGILVNTQRFKGEQRRDLYLADFGDFRVCVAI